MAVKKYDLPFENYLSIEINDPISQELLISELEEIIDEGVSFIIRPEGATEFHGGYLFNVKRVDDSLFEIYAISKRKVTNIEGWANLVSFVNHTSGREYDDNMWNISQQMNFLLFNEEVQPH